MPPGCDGTTHHDDDSLVIGWTCAADVLATGTLEWNEAEHGYVGAIDAGPYGEFSSALASARTSPCRTTSRSSARCGREGPALPRSPRR